VPDPVQRRWPQRVIFAMVGLALVAATAGSIFGPDVVKVSGSVVTARDLRFADRADGAVVVTDTGTGQTVDVLQGEQGFIRATMRGLARARRSEGIGGAAPFRLTAWSDGRLSLDDAETGRHVELGAFGSLNTAVFARLLKAGPYVEQAAGAPL
jgi:putative photosynthetic complex assembly protein